MNLGPALQIVFAIGLEVLGFCSFRCQLPLEAIQFDTLFSSIETITNFN